MCCLSTQPWELVRVPDGFGWTCLPFRSSSRGKTMGERCHRFPVLELNIRKGWPPQCVRSSSGAVAIGAVQEHSCNRGQGWKDRALRIKRVHALCRQRGLGHGGTEATLRLQNYARMMAIQDARGSVDWRLSGATWPACLTIFYSGVGEGGKYGVPTPGI